MNKAEILAFMLNINFEIYHFSPDTSSGEKMCKNSKVLEQ